MFSSAKTKFYTQKHLRVHAVTNHKGSARGFESLIWSVYRPGIARGIITKNLGPRAFRTPRWYARVAMKESSNRQPRGYRSSAKPFYSNRRLTSQAGISIPTFPEKRSVNFNSPFGFAKNRNLRRKKSVVCTVAIYDLSCDHLQQVEKSLNHTFNFHFNQIKFESPRYIFQRYLLSIQKKIRGSEKKLYQSSIASIGSRRNIGKVIKL